MVSAAVEAALQAQRLRKVLAECEAIMGDPNATPERREIAERWYRRLGGVGRPWENAYSFGGSSPAAGHQRHTSGGGQSLQVEANYDGWGTE
jgi:hypothetical protein